MTFMNGACGLRQILHALFGLPMNLPQIGQQAPGGNTVVTHLTREHLPFSYTISHLSSSKELPFSSSFIKADFE